MSLIVVDVESDGAIPHKYSMVCFGAVVVEPSLSKTFYGKTKPISDEWNPDALAISGFSREEHLTFDDPVTVMEKFAEWIKENTNGQATFISDNPAFDWQWINYLLSLLHGQKSVRFQRETHRRFVLRIGKRLFRRFKMEEIQKNNAHAQSG